MIELQQPIPLVVGGNTPPAYRRAIARGNGWYGYWLTAEDVASSLTGLRTAADRVERPADLGELEISVIPRGRITPELVAAYAEAGVHRRGSRSPNAGWAGPHDRDRPRRYRRSLIKRRASPRGVED